MGMDGLMRVDSRRLPRSCDPRRKSTQKKKKEYEGKKRKKEEERDGART